MRYSYILIFITLNSFFQLYAKDIFLAHCPSAEDAITLLTKSPSDLTQLTAVSLQEIKRQRQALVHTEQQTFATAIKPIDLLLTISNAAIMNNLCEAVSLLHPDKKVVAAAKKAVVQLQNAYDDFLSDRKLYQACKRYAKHVDLESLSEQERYFIRVVLSLFERRGAHLPASSYEKIKRIKKELIASEQLFLANLSKKKVVVKIPRTSLEGVKKNFLNSWQHDEDDIYTIPLTQRNYTAIIKDCENEETRKKCFLAWANKTYPENNALLKKIIALRDAYARMLNFKSYAAFDLANQMAETPEKVQQFLDTTYKRLKEKWHAQYAVLQQELPPEIMVTAQETLNPWDLAFLKKAYNKKNNLLPALQEYFPLAPTVRNVVQLLEQFYTIRFSKVPASNFWTSRVQLLQITDQHNKVLSYLFLDLFDRPGKVKGSRTFTIVPATGKYPAVFILTMNIERHKPLLSQDQIRSFTHELGHVIHRMVYTGTIITFGQKGPKDFTEIPSQLQSFWSLYTPILAKKARHYTTNKPMPASLLKAFEDQQKSPYWYPTVERLLYAQLALSYFGSGSSVDVAVEYEKLYKKLFPQLTYVKEDHRYTSFARFITYAAKQYCYMWSKAIALDLFSVIQSQGLTNRAIGKKYIDEVLSKGWSEDPYKLLKNFLAREPHLDLFALPN